MLHSWTCCNGTRTSITGSETGNKLFWNRSTGGRIAAPRDSYPRVKHAYDRIDQYAAMSSPGFTFEPEVLHHETQNKTGEEAIVNHFNVQKVTFRSKS